MITAEPSPPAVKRLEEVIITIDGPAGTGKSTVAHRLAQRLGLEFLDTGAMYRAAALVALEEDIPPNDGDALAGAIRRAELHFDWSADPPAVMLHDRDISRDIRELGVSEIVSVVAAQAEVREALVEQQRQIAGRHPRLVSEGRDQGSVVFPDATVKFFLRADERVRASRRVEQLTKAGQEVDQAQVAEDIRRRDRLDASRSVGPLLQPEDAVVVDTSHRDVEQVVDLLEQTVHQRLTADGLSL